MIYLSLISGISDRRNLQENAMFRSFYLYVIFIFLYVCLSFRLR